jgi:hypothetical protein
VFLAKLGFLSCAFYAAITILLEAALWVVVWFRGSVALFVPEKHWGLRFGVILGALFGLIWLVSFTSAWYLTYLSVRLTFSTAIR